MNPQVINSIAPVNSTSTIGGCGLTGQTDNCRKVECYYCQDMTPICRNISPIITTESKGIGFIRKSFKSVFKCESCFGGTIEEYMDEFYRTHPAW